MEDLLKYWLYIIGFLAYLVSGNPIFLKGLLCIAIAESITSIRLDIEKKIFSFKKSLKKISIKVWYIVLLAISTQLDYIFIEFGIKMTYSITNIMTVSIIVIEITKALNNLQGFGVSVPDILHKVIKKLSDFLNSKG